MTEPVSREQVIEKMRCMVVNGCLGRHDEEQGYKDDILAIFDALTAAREQAERIGNNMHAQITYMIDGITKALKLEGTWTPADVVDAVRNLVPMIEQIDAMKAAREQDRQRMDGLEMQLSVISRTQSFQDTCAELARETELRGHWEALANEYMDRIQAQEQQLATARCAALEQERDEWKDAVLDYPQKCIEVQTLTAALQQAKGALEDFAEYGLRVDMHPTHDLNEPEIFWHGYLKRIDESVRGRAKSALAALDAGPGVFDKLKAQKDAIVEREKQRVIDEWITQKAKEEDGAMVNAGRLAAGPIVSLNTNNSVDTNNGPGVEGKHESPAVTAAFMEVAKQFQPSEPTPCGEAAGPSDHLVDANKMVWTDAKPKVPGWYWWRDKAFVLSGGQKVIEMTQADLNAPWGDTAEWSSQPIPIPIPLPPDGGK